MNCPKCQSDNTQRASVIYEQGTSSINTKSSSIGVASGTRGGFAIGTASTRTQGTQQSLLAKKLAPPGHSVSEVAAIAGLILAGFALYAANVSGFLAKFVSLICFAGAGIGLVYAVYWERTVRPLQVSGWSRTWYCNRCGERYSEPGAYDEYRAAAPNRARYTRIATVSLGASFLVAIVSFNSVTTAGASASSPQAYQSRPQDLWASQSKATQEAQTKYFADINAALATDPCGVSAFLRTGSGPVTGNMTLNPPRGIEVYFATPSRRVRHFVYPSNDGLCKVAMRSGFLVIPTGQHALVMLRQLGVMRPPVLGRTDRQGERLDPSGL